MGGGGAAAQGFVDLRRPLRCDGRPPDGLCTARLALFRRRTTWRWSRRRRRSGRGRPFVHFFDGFRTSHELNTIDSCRRRSPRPRARGARPGAPHRALSPEHPFIRGRRRTRMFTSRPARRSNPFYAHLPGVVEDAMAHLGERTGRSYHVVDYTGHAEAERVVVVMGSGARHAAGHRGRPECARRTDRRGAGASVQAFPGPGARGGTASDRSPKLLSLTGRRSPGLSVSPFPGHTVAALAGGR